MRNALKSNIYTKYCGDIMYINNILWIIVVYAVENQCESPKWADSDSSLGCKTVINKIMESPGRHSVSAKAANSA